MAKEPPQLNTAQRNLKAIIDKSGMTVNAWAVTHKLDQSTINRIVTGKQDMTSEKMQAIATAGHFPAWQLLVEEFNAANPPMLRAETDMERKLYAKIQRDVQELAKLREMNTGPGELE